MEEHKKTCILFFGQQGLTKMVVNESLKKAWLPRRKLAGNSKIYKLATNKRLDLV